MVFVDDFVCSVCAAIEAGVEGGVLAFYGSLQAFCG
jgi:hypothetical protein